MEVFERFTDRARRVLNLAQEEARLLGHPFVGTEHILLGLIHEGEGVAATALESLGITLAAAREKVEETIGITSSPPTASPPFTPRAKKVLELALREALQLGHSFVGTEHLLLGIVREGEGVAAQVLVSLGADLSRVRQQVVQTMSGHRPNEGAAAGALPSGLSRSKRPERGSFAVGRRWSAEVVVAGRRPEDFAAAYDQLAELAGRLGLDDLDASRLHLSSAETDQGPGLLISVTHELPTSEDDAQGDGRDTSALGGRSPSPGDGEQASGVH